MKKDIFFMMNKKSQAKIVPIFIISLVLIAIFGIYFVLAEDIQEIGSIDVDYTNKNMTVEFKDGEALVGKTTLKSHETYDEIRRVTIGENKTVIWYEFSDFKDIEIDSLGNVEFIDMREFIENKTYINKFEGNFELMNRPKILIKNPSYLLPIDKNYSFVYLDEKGEWISYNSFDIPKENIIIGIKIDLSWGEFIDVRFNILGNKLERHALVLGTSAGFVTSAPSVDPEGTNGLADNCASAIKHTSPATAVKITEIGWWSDTATPDVNFEVGLYSDDETNSPNALLEVERTNAKGTDAGWKTVSVDWEVNASTIYWLAFQLDDTDTTYTNTDAGSAYRVRDASVSTLATDWGDDNFEFGAGLVAIYAVWEESDSTPPTYSDAQTNTTNAGESINFSILYNDTALETAGQYIFSTNNTGVWANESVVNFTASPNWANVTKTLNSTGGLAIGYMWYADDNAGNSNNTPIYTLTSSDVTPPTFSTIPTNTSINYNQSIGAYFVGADETELDTYSINWTTLFTINSTGYLSNLSQSIAVGTYQINVTINDTSNNVNSTIYFVEINQSDDDCAIYFNTTSPVTFPEMFIVYTNCSSAYTLSRNGTAISNNSEQNNGAGYWNFSVQRTDTANYSNIFDDEFFTVSKGTGEVYAYVNNSRANLTLNENVEVWLNGTLNVGSGDIKMYWNDTLINSGTSPLSNLTNFTIVGVGVNFSVIYSGNTNWTGDIETWNITILDATPPVITVTAPTAEPITRTDAGQINLVITTDELADCNYSLDSGTNITMGAQGTSHSLLISISLGNHNITYFCMDTASNLGNSSLVIFSTKDKTTEVWGGSSSSFTTTTEDNEFDLADIEIEHDVWYFNEKIYVEFFPLDEVGDIVEITDIEVKVQPTVVVDEGDLVKTLEGTYKKWFILPIQGIDEFEINVTVYQDSHEVTEVFTIKVLEKTFKNKLQSEVKEAVLGFAEFVSEHGVSFLIGFLLLVGVVLVIVLIKRYSNKK